MSFNIMCESSKKIDWHTFNKFKSHNLFNKVEVIPMPELGRNKGDALGVCVPLDNIGMAAWRQLKRMLEYLLDQEEIEIYNLYSGERVTKKNIESLQQEVI